MTIDLMHKAMMVWTQLNSITIMNDGHHLKSLGMVKALPSVNLIN